METTHRILPTAILYRESIVNSAGLTRTLGDIVPCLDYHGEPISYCGAWAVVFKVAFGDGGDKVYALKCYLKDANARAPERFLDNIESDYVICSRYLDHELYVYNQNGEGSYFPVCVMDWADGQVIASTLRRLLRPINRRGEFNPANLCMLRVLCANFRNFAMWLLDQPFAHGDLKSDNIIVDQGMNIKLIDYDNIYVPDCDDGNAMVFSPEYQHSSRCGSSRGLWLDDYSLVLIFVSLLALLERPELFSRLNNGDNIIFSPPIICSDDGRDHPQLEAIRWLRAAWEGRGERLRLLDAVQGDCARVKGVREMIAAVDLHENE